MVIDAPTVDQMRVMPHVALLAAGPWVYCYAGANRETLADRLAVARIGMIAANLDTSVTWLQPEHFHETYRRLTELFGVANVSLMPILDAS